MSISEKKELRQSSFKYELRKLVVRQGLSEINIEIIFGYKKVQLELLES